MFSLQWIRELTKLERQTWVASAGAYALDSFDFTIYSFLIPTLIIQWGMSHSDAGLIASCALFSSSVGGWLAGVLADRYGRVRVLQWTIIFFSLFAFLSGLTHSPEQLLITRAMQGLGFGGEWSLVTVMMAEATRNPKHRGKLVGSVQSSWAIGWGVSIFIYWLIFILLPQEIAWRACFWLGLLPALWLIYLRRYLQDSAIFQLTQQRILQQKQEAKGIERNLSGEKITMGFMSIFSKKYLKTTLYCTLLSTGMLGGHAAICTWMPTYLKTARHLSVTSTGGYMTMLIIGSLIGGLIGAVLSDVLGRRNVLFIFAVGCFLCTLLYMLLPESNTLLLLMVFLLGVVIQGIFAGVGAYFSELFPNEFRGSSQGFCFNIGRGISALFPYLIGLLSNSLPLITAISIVAGCCYFLVIICACKLPETHGKMLL